MVLLAISQAFASAVFRIAHQLDEVRAAVPRLLTLLAPSNERVPPVRTDSGCIAEEVGDLNVVLVDCLHATRSDMATGGSKELADVVRHSTRKHDYLVQRADSLMEAIRVGIVKTSYPASSPIIFAVCS